MQALHDYFERQWIHGIGEAEKLDNSFVFFISRFFQISAWHFKIPNMIIIGITNYQR